MVFALVTPPCGLDAVWEGVGSNVSGLAFWSYLINWELILGFWWKLFFVAMFLLSHSVWKFGWSEKKIPVVWMVICFELNKFSFLGCWRLKHINDFYLICSWTVKELICWRNWKTGTNGDAVVDSWDIMLKNLKKTFQDLICF